jgi:hypothetical protein
LWETLKTLMEGADGAKTAILFSPLPPVNREALSEFRCLLAKEAAGEGFDVEMNEMTLYRREMGNDGEGFIRMAITKK